jgi:hypothetical protein
MKHPSTIAAAALLLVACNDNLVAPEPSAAKSPGLRPTASLSAAALESNLDFETDLGDLKRRVLPALNDQEAASRLRSALDTLSSHLAAADRSAAAADIALVREQLKPEVGSGADIGNISLVLDMIENAL